MFEFLRDAFSASPDSETLSLSSNTIEGGVDVTVGRTGCAQLIHLPPVVRRACPFLREIDHGSAIPDVDPVLFQIVVDYLDSRTLLDKMNPASTCVLGKLADGSKMTLEFAKAWHLGHALGLPELQNKLVDVFREAYVQLQHDRIQLVPDAAPFTLLRDYIGYHTPAEKFLVDFYAGLYRYDKAFSMEKLRGVPKDIADYIMNRWSLLADLGNPADRIINNDPNFKVRMAEHPELRAKLRIVPPPSWPPLTPPTTPKQASAVLAKSPSTHQLRVRIAIPGVESVTGEPEVLVEPDLVPSLATSLGAKPPQNSRRARRPSILSRTSWMSGSPAE
ncbi:hypothetical protein BU26DRAFT_511762 [Trematosphaeria pertusa]|uniref:BTB domain-containing protein n=1 Tax=Trematosphaeria pertusa TaxID=390896 RepID=A0A6A6HT52_9PLEO|nr:uncharacterized protein BU26DRAFT_511762 [Trematosphaeria pertusa]KAF2240948.1 hypothetical protein BU26DRAFT_511762 [Trematosphaeria pertusa]